MMTGPNLIPLTETKQNDYQRAHVTMAAACQSCDLKSAKSFGQAELPVKAKCWKIWRYW